MMNLNRQRSPSNANNGSAPPPPPPKRAAGSMPGASMAAAVAERSLCRAQQNSVFVMGGHSEGEEGLHGNSTMSTTH